MPESIRQHLPWIVALLMGLSGGAVTGTEYGVRQAPEEARRERDLLGQAMADLRAEREGCEERVARCWQRFREECR